jgi:peptidoglycan/xylan/chitin deacetylase (PgdA/CDA1 family)
LKVPILLYHQLFNKELNNEKYAISRNEFERQIEYLSNNGFKSILIDDLCESLKLKNTDKKPIAITFDDGNYSDYSIAVPILKKYGFVATFFVTVNWLEKKKYLKWSHIKKIKEAGMSVQSHSLTHSFLSDIKSNQLFKEIYESKKVIEERTNSRVHYFSLPGGFFSTKVLSVLKENNYIGVCTSVPGMNRLITEQKEFFILNRLLITRKTSFNKYKAIANGSSNVIALCKVEHYLKETGKKLLGKRNYYFIWSRLFREI